MARWDRGRATWDSGGDDRFAVPPGFRVELAVKAPRTTAGHSPLVNMTFDAKGRLLLSQEGGPILLCTEPNKDGVFQSSQAVLHPGQELPGHVLGQGRPAAGRRRAAGDRPLPVRDTKGKDQIDEVTLLHKFRGGMGEHGPHAIIHGPDDWLYVVIGNHAGANVDQKLAANSPLTRWPTGGRWAPIRASRHHRGRAAAALNDASGHAANILAPGRHHLADGPRGQEREPGRRRLPQPLRRRL